MGVGINARCEDRHWRSLTPDLYGQWFVPPARAPFFPVGAASGILRA